MAFNVFTKKKVISNNSSFLSNLNFITLLVEVVQHSKFFRVFRHQIPDFFGYIFKLQIIPNKKAILITISVRHLPIFLNKITRL